MKAETTELDPMIYRFKISQFPFHTPFDSQFLPVSLPFSTKIMLFLYDMGLFSNSTICGVTFDSKRLDFQSHVLTGSSASNPKFRFGFR